MLTEEQIQKIKKKEYDAERRREKAAEQYASKAAEKKEADSQTPDSFWAKNRNRESQTQIAALLEQQERVFDKLYWTECQIDGSYNDPTSPHFTDPTDPDYVSLEEGTANLEDFVKKYGTCEMFVMYPEFWRGSFAQSVAKLSRGSECNRRFLQQAEDNKFPHVYDFIKRNNATGIFARFGILTAVPGHRLYEWETFLASKRPPTPQPSNSLYVKMARSSLTCGNAITRTQIVSESIAADYTSLGKP